MEKKKEIKWYNIVIAIIVSICIYFSMILCIYSLLKPKKAGAYTNNVVTYNNITNLTGSTWLFNETPSYSTSLDVTYYIDIIYSSFGEDDKIANSITFTGFQSPSSYEYMIQCGYDPIYNAGWQGPTPQTQTIKITGGTDVTNNNLIDLLYENATLIGIDAQEEIYNISYNLQNVLVIGEKPTQISNLEEISIEIQNFNNYELPQNIMVENANYNWNYETGILTIYDAKGNVSITIRAEYISGNYSFIELIDSVVLIPLNTFFNLFNFDIFGVNIYALLTATLTLFVIIKILLKVFK